MTWNEIHGELLGDMSVLTGMNHGWLVVNG